MTRPAILWVPPPERAAEVLGASMGGGTVPVMYRGVVSGRWRRTKPLNYDARALLLAHAGTPDAIGMGRAREVLAVFEGYATSAGEAAEFSRVFGGFAVGCGQYAYYVGDPNRAEIGPLSRMAPVVVPGLTSDMPLPLALATILATRIGGSVEVING